MTEPEADMPHILGELRALCEHSELHPETGASLTILLDEFVRRGLALREAAVLVEWAQSVGEQGKLIAAHSLLMRAALRRVVDAHGPEAPAAIDAARKLLEDEQE